MFLFSFTILGLSLLLVPIIRLILEARRTTANYWHLPWAGTEKKSSLSLWRARLRNITALKQDFHNLTEEHWSRGRACFVPSLLGDTVVLPPQELEWLADQPDDVLNNAAQIIETVQPSYTMCSQHVIDHPTHHRIISRDLTRRLGELTSDIFDEVAAALDAEWGNDTEVWKEVNPFTTLMNVVARTANRVFVGLPLCRNEDLLDNVQSFATSVIPSALFIHFIPELLRPSIAPLFTWQNKRYRRKLAELIEPECRRRQALYDGAAKDGHEQNDMLQWFIHAAEHSDLPAEREPSIICQRLLLSNFAAIHTTTLSMTNVIYDLISSPSALEIVHELRDEVSMVLSANDNVWTKNGVSRLHKVDSTLKESMRLGELNALGIQRIVVKQDGLESPISRTYLPEGATVAIPVRAIHSDSRLYPDPSTYRPFRFSNLRSASSTVGADEGQAEKAPTILHTAKLSMATTTPAYQPFGHGRHACLSRFFASNDLKLLLAYIVQHYDLQMIEERPKIAWIGSMRIPPMKNTIWLRRREKV